MRIKARPALAGFLGAAANCGRDVPLRLGALSGIARRGAVNPLKFLRRLRFFELAGVL